MKINLLLLSFAILLPTTAQASDYWSSPPDQLLAAELLVVSQSGDRLVSLSDSKLERTIVSSRYYWKETEDRNLFVTRVFVSVEKSSTFASILQVDCGRRQFTAVVDPWEVKGGQMFRLGGFIGKVFGFSEGGLGESAELTCTQAFKEKQEVDR